MRLDETKTGTVLTLTSDSVFRLALAVYNAGEKGADLSEFRAKLIAQLVIEAVQLKNVELHMKAAHSGGLPAGGFGHAH